MQRLIIILILLGTFPFINGQDRTDYAYFDSITYKQYTDANWKELTKDSKEAIKLGYDYYYMRMRLGISYYERKLYLKAIPHFRLALEFNHKDQVAIEYIYYCYLLSANYNIANAVSRQFRPSLVEKTGINKDSENRISVDYLYNNATSENIINEYLSINGLIDPGNLIIPISYSNFGITLYHDINPTVSIKHSLSYLSRKNSLFVNDETVSYSDYVQKVKQIQYFFTTTISYENGLSISPSLYYLNTTYPLIDFTTTGMQAFAYTYPVMENNIGAGINLFRTVGMINIGGSANFSHLGFRNHVQFGAELIFNPLANNFLYMGAAYNYKLSEVASEYEKGYVLKLMAGVSFKNKLYIDFSILSGDLQNFIENGGQIVYNSINEIDNIIKADLSVPFGVSGVIMYLGARYSSEYSAHIPIDYLYSTTSENKLNSLSIIGGLSWTF